MILEIYDSNGNRTYVGREGHPNNTNFQYQFRVYFSKLAPGDYYYRMTGYNALNQAVESRKYNFTVLQNISWGIY